MSSPQQPSGPPGFSSGPQEGSRPPSEPPPIYPRKRSPLRMALTIIFAILGGSTLSCCGFGTVSYVFFAHEFDEPLEESDRQLLITATSIAQHAPDLTVDEGFGHTWKTRNLDGCKQLYYEYVTPNESDKSLYISYCATVDVDATDARTAYLMEKWQLRLDWRCKRTATASSLIAMISGNGATIRIAACS
jgi:hypothetical protein